MRSQMTAAVFQATSLGAASNVLGQLVSAYRGGRAISLDIPQLARFLAFALLTAPMNYKFQQLLEHAFPAHGNARARRRPGRFRRPAGVGPEGDRSYKRDDIDLDNLEKGAAPTASWRPSSTIGSGSTSSSSSSLPQPRLNWWNTMAKWFLDCISLGTFINTVAFLVIMGVLKGQSAGQVASTLRKQLAPLIFAGYRVWPIASFISFTCVPLEHRIAWLSTVGLLWGVYMSLVAESV